MFPCVVGRKNRQTRPDAENEDRIKEKPMVTLHFGHVQGLEAEEQRKLQDLADVYQLSLIHI